MRLATILVTHDQAEALSFADQVAVMREGRLVQAGAPEELYRRPIDKGVATFLGEALFFAAKIDGAFADCVLGRVPVENANGAASGEIFVRPEQLRLVAAGDPASVARARVAGVAFSGPSSSVTLVLANGGTIAAPCASAFRPDPGDAVGIALTGAARLI